jgi:hypothetical protein
LKCCSICTSRHCKLLYYTDSGYTTSSLIALFLAWIAQYAPHILLGMPNRCSNSKPHCCGTQPSRKAYRNSINKTFTFPAVLALLPRQTGGLRPHGRYRSRRRVSHRAALSLPPTSEQSAATVAQGAGKTLTLARASSHRKLLVPRTWA